MQKNDIKKGKKRKYTRNEYLIQKYEIYIQNSFIYNVKHQEHVGRHK